MRNIILLFTLIATVYVNAQVFPEKDIKLLEGHLIKIDNGHKESGFENFYTDEDATNIYAKKAGRYLTNYDSLIGRTFKVINVKKESEENDKQDAILLLEDINNKRVLYYKYDFLMLSYFFKVIDTIDYPADYFCRYITKDNIGSTTFTKAGAKKSFKIIKVYDPEIPKEYPKTYYAIDMEFGTSKYTDKRNGVTLLLENGKKIDLPKQKVTVGTAMYDYKTIVLLTDAHMELLKSNRITGYKILEFTKEFDASESEILFRSLKCLLTK